MPSMAMSSGYTLSKREAECVSWVAIGKTSSEVSQILGITERTVNFHVQNSMAKFNAVNRTHLIALFTTSQVIHAIEESACHKVCKTCPLNKGDRVLGTVFVNYICERICGKKLERKQMAQTS